MTDDDPIEGLLRARNKLRSEQRQLASVRARAGSYLTMMKDTRTAAERWGERRVKECLCELWEAQLLAAAHLLVALGVDRVVTDALRMKDDR